MAKQLRRFLTVTSRGEVKMTSKRPRLKFNEFAVLIIVDIPDSFWGKLTPEPLRIELPDGLEMPQAVVGDRYD